MMKYLKKYDKFFEDGDGGGVVAGGGVATANASNTAGPGNVVAAQPGAFAGTTGPAGSGDVGFVLGANPKKRGRGRKKGDPSQVSDLRDLKEVDTMDL
jgi:hypothetical protein